MVRDADKRVSWSLARIRRLRRWRALSGAAGLLLLTCFFMPAVEGCNQPVVPAEEGKQIIQTLTDHALSASQIFPAYIGFIVFVFPYLFGLLVLIVSLRSRSYRRATEGNLGISIAVFMGLVLVPLGVFSLIQITVLQEWYWDIGFIVFTILAAFSLLYFLKSVRMGPAGLLCLRWYASVCGLIWFGGWWIAAGLQDSYYGLWLSFLATLVILVSAHAEAVIRTTQPHRKTIWNLARCRLQLHDLDGRRCLNCGYLLIGLTHPRCPECGRPFNVEDHCTA